MTSFEDSARKCDSDTESQEVDRMVSEMADQLRAERRAELGGKRVRVDPALVRASNRSKEDELVFEPISQEVRDALKKIYDSLD